MIFRRGLVCLLLAAGLLLGSGCTTSPISSSVGDDAWARRVTETWIPRTHQALAYFDEFSVTQFGQKLQTHPHVIIASNREQGRRLQEISIDTIVIILESTNNPQNLYDRSVRLPVHDYSLVLQQELAAGKAERAAQWLREGSANLMADRVLARVGDENVAKAWFAQGTFAVRNMQNIVTPAELLHVTTGMEKRPGFQNVAELMTAHLNDLLGDRFFPAWASYFRAMASADLQPEQAFRSSFGMSEEDFMRSVDVKLDTIRAQLREHAQPVPPASDYAKISDLSRLPLQDELARKGYQQYLRGRAPKAFAFSSRGAWSYVLDNDDAMKNALATCRAGDPVSCQLYAIDDHVVYRPTEAGSAAVEVVMMSDSKDAWTLEVRDHWYPLVQRATEQFNKLMEERMGVGLDESARISLVSNRPDYERILRDDMKIFASEAAIHAEITGGMSNSRGLIAVVLLSPKFGGPEATQQLRERAIKTPLHELAHELQGQLSKRYRGFPVPEWIKEGTADLLAFDAAKDLQVEGASQFSPEAWKSRCAAWYKQGGPQVAPEELFTTKTAEWTKMLAARRGPYQMAGLMSMYLQSRMGERFFAAWVAYFRLAGQRDQEEPVAFEKSFGLSRAEFLDGFKVWLRTL
ncbi:MAG: hypothetical protein JWN23_1283 [Rhodocyclales bacterium]|nr:hypothetical protein [Rhodocyclales bacterium]